ncbi:hypothetical protein F4V43_05205 [Paenibacillus spiritus]|uniref:Preprotein translocase subunit Tim44 n=1 Tax=Paenibacillus spiritus TaxID=2496557 RepID=A0A5J5GE52_9BACL|nr:hypothetical protein [Paenibacillus spiritus]KAA9006357.1 hypothetical protein F4V43_05205 [Paenibacillus spiritus]
MKHTKRVLMIMMAFTLFFATSVHDLADARKGGGFKSGVRSYQTTPKKSTQSGVSKSDSSSTKSGTAAAQTKKRGFFSGGSLMKGIMIGGIAGLLFGGMFANMGAFGSFLGLMVNMLALYLVVVLVLSFFRRRRERRRYEAQREGRY